MNDGEADSCFPPEQQADSIPTVRVVLEGKESPQAFNKLSDNGMKNYRSFFESHQTEPFQLFDLISCGSYFATVDVSDGGLCDRYVNQHLIECLGLEACDCDIPDTGFSARAWWNLIHDDDVQQVRDQIQKCINGKNNLIQLQYRMRRGDGSFRYTRDTAQFVKSQDHSSPIWFGVLADIDAQVRTDQQLRQRNEEMRLVLDTIPTLLWIKDHQHRILQVNRAASRASGMEPDEIAGKLTQDVYPLLGRHSIASEDQLIQSGSAVHNLTESLQNQSGEIRKLIIDKYPIPGRDETEDRILVVGTDVTAIADAEQALLRSEQRFRYLFESSPVGMLLVAEDGTIQLSNTQAEKTFGYDHGELVGLSIEQLVPQSRREVHRKHRADYTKSPSTRPMGGGHEFDGQTKRGTRIQVEVALSQIEIDEQRLTMASVINVTERSRTATLLRLASEVGNVGFWEFGIAKQDVHVSDQLLNQLGLKNSFTSIDDFQKLLHPDDVEQTLRAFEEYVAGKRKQYEVIFRMKHADGDFRWILSRGRKILDADGSLVQVVGFHVEITQQYESRLDLEEKTRELQRSNQDLDRFAFIASHDLKAPLRGITHLSEWINEDLPEDVSEDVRAHIRMLNKQVQRMDLLLDDLLVYSQVGRDERDTELVDVGKIVEELFQFMSPSSRARLVIRGDLPTFKTSRAPLEQVLRNLIGNALKHGPSIECVVTVSCKQVDDTYQFCVADNGEGIDAAYHQRIFRMFETLKPKSDGSGTGMGLAMVQRLCDHHGGKCWVESAPGRGARFYFSWPINLAATLKRLRDENSQGFVPSNPPT